MTFCRTWNYANCRQKESAIRRIPIRRPISTGICGWGPLRNVHSMRTDSVSIPKTYSHFRWFWDYAGGMMTDWGIHLLDIVQMAFDEVDAEID